MVQTLIFAKLLFSIVLNLMFFKKKNTYTTLTDKSFKKFLFPFMATVFFKRFHCITLNSMKLNYFNSNSIIKEKNIKETMICILSVLNFLKSI